MHCYMEHPCAKKRAIFASDILRWKPPYTYTFKQMVDKKTLAKVGVTSELLQEKHKILSDY